MVAVFACFPTLAAAQEQTALWTDLAGSRIRTAFEVQDKEKEIFPAFPNLRPSLTLLATGNFPADTLITNSGIRYSDILNPGIGLRVEGDLLAEFEHNKASGVYAALEWNWFNGRPNVDMRTGQVLSFDTLNTFTCIVGAKVIAEFPETIFVEGRLGGGFVNFGQLTYTDVTAPPPVAGRQFFRPLTRGVFEIGARFSPLNSRHFNLDMGVALRVMGAMAPGANVNPPAVDPRFFVTYTLEIGLTIRL
jgi:hypothetical protein